MRGFFARSQCGIFASRSVTAHLLRGIAGIVLLAWALGQTHPALTVAGVLGAVVALRGCPMCWTVGLLETIGQRLLAWRVARSKKNLLEHVDPLAPRSTV